jgi:hypothetical protein
MERIGIVSSSEAMNLPCRDTCMGIIAIDKVHSEYARDILTFFDQFFII